MVITTYGSCWTIFDQEIGLKDYSCQGLSTKQGAILISHAVTQYKSSAKSENQIYPALFWQISW